MQSICQYTTPKTWESQQEPGQHSHLQVSSFLSVVAAISEVQIEKGNLKVK